MSSSAEDARVALVMYASRQLGRAYIWGGESSEEGGFDCSGFVSHCLEQVARSWPTIYDGRRRTSRSLRTYYRDRGLEEITEVDELRPGCLVFYHPARGGRIYHVAIHATTVPPLDRRLPFGPLAIEAGGGGSANRSPRDSLRRPAGVRFAASDVHGSASWKALDPFALLED